MRLAPDPDHSLFYTRHSHRGWDAPISRGYLGLLCLGLFPHEGIRLPEPLGTRCEAHELVVQPRLQYMVLHIPPSQMGSLLAHCKHCPSRNSLLVGPHAPKQHLLHPHLRCTRILHHRRQLTNPRHPPPHRHRLYPRPPPRAQKNHRYPQTAYSSKPILHLN